MTIYLRFNQCIIRNSYSVDLQTIINNYNYAKVMRCMWVYFSDPIFKDLAN